MLSRFSRYRLHYTPQHLTACLSAQHADAKLVFQVCLLLATLACCQITGLAAHLHIRQLVDAQGLAAACHAFLLVKLGSSLPCPVSWYNRSLLQSSTSFLLQSCCLKGCQLTTDTGYDLQKSSQPTARSAGEPFFGQQGPAPTVPPTKASNAAAQQFPTQQQGGRTPGTAFFAEGGGAESSSAQQVPTQTLKMQQAAARNRAQKPSGKTNDAKPIFKVCLRLARHLYC